MDDKNDFDDRRHEAERRNDVTCRTHNSTMRSLAKIEQSQETMQKDMEAVRLLLSRMVSLEERFLNMADTVKDIKVYNTETEKRMDSLESKIYSMEKANERFMAIIAVGATLIAAFISVYPWKTH